MAHVKCTCNMWYFSITLSTFSLYFLFYMPSVCPSLSPSPYVLPILHARPSLLSSLFLVYSTITLYLPQFILSLLFESYWRPHSLQFYYLTFVSFPIFFPSLLLITCRCILSFCYPFITDAFRIHATWLRHHEGCGSMHPALTHLSTAMWSYCKRCVIPNQMSIL